MIEPVSPRHERLRGRETAFPWERPSRAYFHVTRNAAAPETGAAANHAMRIVRPGAHRRPEAARPQAGLPAAASTAARTFTRGVRALLRMSVLTYFVE